MAEIDRYRCEWTGFAGGPGWSTIHAEEDSGVLNHFHGFLEALKVFFPPTVKISFPTVADVIDVETGEIVRTEAQTPLSTVIGGGNIAVTYAAPAGVCVNWLTDDRRYGRRLRGRTFLVPMLSSVFQSDGSIDNQTVTDIRIAASGFVSESAGNFLVYSPKVDAEHATPSNPVRPGSKHVVKTATVRDAVSVLRTRRA